jgi:hypothetical protein
MLPGLPMPTPGDDLARERPGLQAAIFLSGLGTTLLAASSINVGGDDHCGTRRS